MTKYAIETINITKIFKIREKGERTAAWGGIFPKIKRIILGGTRKTITAVDHVNLKIKEGEFFGLLGPNGAGKSTLIKILATMYLPDEGTAIVNGYDVVSERYKAKSSISVIISEAWLGFDYYQTAKENLEFWAVLYGLPPDAVRKNVDFALEMTGLMERANDTPMHFSSGMKQRLSIAKGLLLDAPIFLMDEPTVKLDPVAAKQTREFIRETLNDKMKRTILFTTHYMIEADQLCDRIAIIDRGKIIALDTPENLKRIVKEEDVIELKAINIVPGIESRIKGLDLVDKVVGSIDDPVIGKGVIRVHTKEAEDTLPKVLDIMSAQNVRITSIRVAQPTLEDVFIKMTGKGLK